MKISGRKNVSSTGALGKAKDANKSAAADQSVKGGGAGKSDSIDISVASRQLMNAKAIVDASPEIRIEKVSEIKLQIDDGQYYVESDKIAKKMVLESLNESLERRK